MKFSEMVENRKINLRRRYGHFCCSVITLGKPCFPFNRVLKITELLGGIELGYLKSVQNFVNY
jgi:hypothetical protein